MIPIQGRKHLDSTHEEAVENGALVVRDLKPEVLFPVMPYTKEQVRLDPLRRKLKEMKVETRLFFDRPGTVHTLSEY